MHFSAVIVLFHVELIDLVAHNNGIVSIRKIVCLQIVTITSLFYSSSYIVKK
jgi:hypothetical protein